MKKNLMILLGIGISIIVFTSLLKAEKLETTHVHSLCSDNECTHCSQQCDNPYHICSGEKPLSEYNANENDACYCPNCDEQVVMDNISEDVWVKCWPCSGEGVVNCAQKEWQNCSPCRGTGCKNGYTTDNGKYCAYGHCSSCNGKGGKYVNVMKKACKCSSCGGEGGKYQNQVRRTTVCPRCRKEIRC